MTSPPNSLLDWEHAAFILVPFCLDKAGGPWDIESQVCFPEIKPRLFQKSLSMSAHASQHEFPCQQKILAYNHAVCSQRSLIFGRPELRHYLWFPRIAPIVSAKLFAYS